MSIVQNAAAGLLNNAAMLLLLLLLMMMMMSDDSIARCLKMLLIFRSLISFRHSISKVDFSSFIKYC